MAGLGATPGGGDRFALSCVSGRDLSLPIAERAISSIDRGKALAALRDLSERLIGEAEKISASNYPSNCLAGVIAECLCRIEGTDSRSKIWTLEDIDDKMDSLSELASSVSSRNPITQIIWEYQKEKMLLVFGFIDDCGKEVARLTGQLTEIQEKKCPRKEAEEMIRKRTREAIIGFSEIAIRWLDSTTN